MSKLRNMTTGKIVASDVFVAKGVVSRMVGFLNRSRIEPSEGLWFDGCSAIHTVGMRQPIDVVFLDRRGRVVRTLCAVPPNRIAVGCPNAQTTIELGAGALERSDILVGDRFALE